MAEQYFGQNKKQIGHTMIYKTLHCKLKIQQDKPHNKPVVNACATEEYTVLSAHVASVVILLLETR